MKDLFNARVNIQGEQEESGEKERIKERIKERRRLITGNLRSNEKNL